MRLDGSTRRATVRAPSALEFSARAPNLACRRAPGSVVLEPVYLPACSFVVPVAQHLRSQYAPAVDYKVAIPRRAESSVAQPSGLRRWHAVPPQWHGRPRSRSRFRMGVRRARRNHGAAIPFRRDCRRSTRAVSRGKLLAAESGCPLNGTVFVDHFVPARLLHTHVTVTPCKCEPNVGASVTDDTTVTVPPELSCARSAGDKVTKW